jgi:hypothetical protein
MNDIVTSIAAHPVLSHENCTSKGEKWAGDAEQPARQALQSFSGR